MRYELGTNDYVPFGPKDTVLGGDLRQIIQVISKGSKSDIVGSAINAAYLRNYCKVGDGKLNHHDEEDSDFEILADLLIDDSESSLNRLIKFTYPEILKNLTLKNYKNFEEKALLSPTLESVQNVNNMMLSMIPGEENEYLSSDTTCRSDEDTLGSE
ncbi:uncharacterized protein LOC130712836 [Lotus japonicus]|uniref:uncharacterized protein LOC130712836 n=1 Tax=Lotus japonicus TaxID=34305 RepID=UPI0025841DC9|nr:uncharacterized protein LOC130712836 [Lotus japonicus]